MPVSSSYATALSDAQFELIEPMLPAPCRRGRRRKHALRLILEALAYLVRAGCAWRLLPRHCFPPWQTVFGYFRRWRADGRRGHPLKVPIKTKKLRHKLSQPHLFFFG